MSFFGVSCVDVNDEKDLGMRQEMCGQLEHCSFDFPSRQCAPRRLSRPVGSRRLMHSRRSPSRSRRSQSPQFNLKTFKSELQNNPGSVRAVISAISEAADQEDTEPLVSKVIKYAVLPLMAYGAYKFVSEADLINIVVKVLRFLKTHLSEATFANFFDKFTVKMSPADVLFYFQGMTPVENWWMVDPDPNIVLAKKGDTAK